MTYRIAVVGLLAMIAANTMPARLQAVGSLAYGVIAAVLAYGVVGAIYDRD